MFKFSYFQDLDPTNLRSLAGRSSSITSGMWYMVYMVMIRLALYPHCPVTNCKGLYTQIPWHFVKFIVSMMDVHKKNRISLNSRVDFILHFRRSRTQKYVPSPFRTTMSAGCCSSQVYLVNDFDVYDCCMLDCRGGQGRGDLTLRAQFSVWRKMHLSQFKQQYRQECHRT